MKMCASLQSISLVVLLMVSCSQLVYGSEEFRKFIPQKLEEKKNSISTSHIQTANTYGERCHFGDTKCIAGVINEMFRRTPAGVAVDSLGVPLWDPLKTDRLQLSAGRKGEAFHILINMTDVKLIGFAKSYAKKVE